MASQVNQSRKYKITIIAIIGLLLVAFSTDAQLFKKKNKNKGKKTDSREEYAYQTFSTTQRKERKKSFTGEAKFHFDKPLLPVPFGKIDRDVDYAKAPYFGHKRPPIKRPPGSQKLCKVCGIKH